MKPEFMRLRRALTLTLATLLAAGGITLLSPASAALAHHNTVSASAACVDSTWTITWRIQNSESDKAETITVSSNPDIVPVGTEIAAGDTFTATETVPGPTSRTLSVVGYWPSSNVTDSLRTASITPYDFAGTCGAPSYPGEPGEPIAAAISIAATPCVYDGTVATADVTATVTGVPAGTPYTIELFTGDTSVGYVNDIAGGGTVTAIFPGLAPGDYHAEVQPYGGSVVPSTTVTVPDCTPTEPGEPIEPEEPVEPEEPIEPGEPLPPVSPPRLVITPVDCSSDVTTPTVYVGVSGLDAAQSYQVVLLDEAGLPVASQPLTGVVADNVVFSNLVAPASYAAVLQVEPGGVTEAETVDLAYVVPCIAGGGVLPPLPTLPLPEDVPPATIGSNVVPSATVGAAQLPTLALTGASDARGMIGFAALLLAAGAALVAMRNRSRVDA